ncbi:PhoH family protein [Aliarcobacter butzleri]|uniref:PhoH-like protein n=1 Tax=Aliarcobacter butzleri L351 TaxID=1447259 RepID=A0A837J8T3_9BACT|nr:PhoH family protein [Aliarcobacter butzleri]KLE02893.1 phosphate starvation protein PhoH [Aliarcobacter butzleri L351]KLE13924.1 phosphate starvation protein PhoH [Aliarcobacter butzleri L350]MDN5047312.1 PhoH family protein [Aliarcobacter butzleri]MDN5058633.1 PhoH family protein [Aliarcobacter butzleri]MDN5109205.1 PhoH family protein [Aliarcobacter butzleri]
MFDKYYVLDTNILLEDATNIYKLSQDGKNLIILAETVLDEIDTKKSGFDEINFQAREFARILEDSNIISSTKKDLYKIIRLKINNKDTVIDIISKDEYEINSKNVSLNIINDRKILEISTFANTYYKHKVEFISLDIMARTRAISLDIKTNSLLGKDKDIFDLDFIKYIDINFEDLEHLDNEEIIKFDKEYKPYNFSYCFKVRHSDQVVLANIQNKKIKLLDEVEIRDQVITPLNKEQLFFSDAIINHFYNVLIIEAKAGSGKTLLALSGALKLVRQKFFQKIIYIRNSIESLDKGEDVGYLPGLEEKFKIYNHPLMDSLDYIIRTEHKRKRNKKAPDVVFQQLDDSEVTTRIEQMISNYGIETMWVGEMRGRTLSNSFIIIDEAQNMSNKTMQMVLSRIDSSCKVVVLGSNKQIDNFYVNKYTNALTTLLKSTKNEDNLVNIFAIKLEKVLRGPITEWAEQIFSK